MLCNKFFNPSTFEDKIFVVQTSVDIDAEET